MEWCSYKGFSHNSHNFILQTPDSADLSKVAQGFLLGGFLLMGSFRCCVVCSMVGSSEVVVVGRVADDGDVWGVPGRG